MHHKLGPAGAELGQAKLKLGKCDRKTNRGQKTDKIQTIVKISSAERKLKRVRRNTQQG